MIILMPKKILSKNKAQSWVMKNLSIKIMFQSMDNFIFFWGDFYVFDINP